MTRRALLGLLLLGGCSVLPNRPYQEPQRFALSAERPRQEAPARRGPVLLLRTLRSAPGLDQRGLRVLGPDGRVEVEYWNEWVAPPVELVEEALRRWLTASGRFAGVTLPGSRIRPDLILEGELTRLEAVPAAGEARAALSVLLDEEGRSGAAQRILGQFVAEGAAPLPRGQREGAVAAAAMAAALGAALAETERRLAAAMAPPGARAGRR